MKTFLSLLPILLVASSFHLAPAFADDDGDDAAVRSCLNFWNKHPFGKGSLPEYKTLSRKVKVLGIGGDIRDTEVTSKPTLILVRPSVTVLSGSDMSLMNPNGWYCLKEQVTVLGGAKIELQCKAHLASSKDGATVLGGADREGGVTVLGASRITRVGCDAATEASESESKSSAKPAASPAP